MDSANPDRATHATKAAITVSVVWVVTDWPHADPVSASGQPLFALPGAEPTQVEALRGIRVSVADPEPVHDLLSRLLTEQAEERMSNGQIGVSVFGRRLRKGQLVCDGDRIEILGPISADPKSERRQRVRQQREEASRSVWNRK